MPCRGGLQASRALRLNLPDRPGDASGRQRPGPGTGSLLGLVTQRRNLDRRPRWSFIFVSANLNITESASDSVIYYHGPAGPARTRCQLLQIPKHCLGICSS